MKMGIDGNVLDKEVIFCGSDKNDLTLQIKTHDLIKLEFPVILDIVK